MSVLDLAIAREGGRHRDVRGTSVMPATLLPAGDLYPAVKGVFLVDLVKKKGKEKKK